jgi:hypothetical protein
MNRTSVVMALMCAAALGFPPTTSAAGSYGAVVEKGIRDCAIDRDSGVVICFESPSVNSQSRGLFLQAWRTAHLYLARWDTGPAMLRVRTMSVSAVISPRDRRVITYLVSTDLVTPELVCRDDFRFLGSDGAVRLESFVSACTP